MTTMVGAIPATAVTSGEVPTLTRLEGYLTFITESRKPFPIWVLQKDRYRCVRGSSNQSDHVLVYSGTSGSFRV